MPAVLATMMAAHWDKKLTKAQIFETSIEGSDVGRRTFSVLRSTCSWRVTTYVGKPSAMGQPTRPTQPVIPSGSIDE